MTKKKISIIIGVLILVVLSVFIVISRNKTKPTDGITELTIDTIPGYEPTTIPIIDISNNKFVQDKLTIKKNKTVSWANDDNITHTVTSKNNKLNSGDIAAHAIFTYKFTQIGTYTYHCKYHPNMTGTIVVTD